MSEIGFFFFSNFRDGRVFLKCQFFFPLSFLLPFPGPLFVFVLSAIDRSGLLIFFGWLVWIPLERNSLVSDLFFLVLASILPPGL